MNNQANATTHSAQRTIPSTDLNRKHALEVTAKLSTLNFGERG